MSGIRRPVPKGYADYEMTAEILGVRLRGSNLSQNINTRIRHGSIPKPTIPANGRGYRNLWLISDLKKFKAERDKYVTCRQFAELLGLSVSRFYKLNAAGDIIKPARTNQTGHSFWLKDAANRFAERRAKFKEARQNLKGKDTLLMRVEIERTLLNRIEAAKGNQSRAYWITHVLAEAVAKEEQCQR